ncbi:helix-turn-helix domain-containing protein [Bacillus cereus]|uniref:helix-turn-helix domain-containing protein n=1 Tax=Bacillus cereus TaxID=1396 RepID=UPI0011421137|nr:helix-turn-helix domain-containing protein [Bacillus cereus]
MATFSFEVKIIALKLYLEGDQEYKVISKNLGVCKRKLQYWVKKYQIHRENAFLMTYTN